VVEHLRKRNLMRSSPITAVSNRLASARSTRQWRDIPQGILWRRTYLFRSLMLITMAAAAATSGDYVVSAAVLAIALPFNVMVGRQHVRQGVPSRYLFLDQILAGACVLLSARVALGAAVAIMGGAVTGSLAGNKVRHERATAFGVFLVMVGGVIHREFEMSMLAVALLATALAISHLVTQIVERQLNTVGRFEDILDTLNALVIETDALTGQITYANHRANEIVGSSQTRNFLTHVVHPDDQERARSMMEQAFLTRTPVTLEVRLVDADADGNCNVVHMEQRTTFAEVKGKTRIRSVLVDVAERKQMQAEITHRALHDPLTDLPNLDLLRDRNMHAIARAHRKPTEHTLILIDVVSIAEINHSLGHRAAEELLLVVAQRLTTVSRTSDTLARTGSQQFALLLEDTPVTRVPEVCERIRRTIELEVWCLGRSMVPTVRMGVSSYPGHARTEEDLYRRADMALQTSKAEQVPIVVFDPSMQRNSDLRLSIARDFRSALEANQLKAFLHPVVDVLAKQIHSFEALIRWDHPALGLLEPRDFLTTVIDAGLSSELARWMLTTTFDQIESWRDTGVEVPVSVNLCALDLTDSDLVTWIVGEVAARNIPKHLINLETTEAELASRPGQAFAGMLRLRDAGLGIIIDDFGIGVGSLALLRDLCVDAVKIDVSFVDAICHDPRSATIVKSTVDMARSLGIDVIAEGVENDEVAAALADIGCRLMQGYLFTRPGPREEALDVKIEYPALRGLQVVSA
jgi:diguanylate cyclase (GGDEF)-like protein/PAS domain S-box-containing protein